MPVPTDNYDDTSVGRYIRAIENPDSVGFDLVMRRWYAPTNVAVFDKNNRGMGVDVVRNSDAAATASGRTGKWLTEQEERDLRNGHIAYSLGVMDRRAPLVVKGAAASPTLQDMAVGVIYKGNANELFNPTTPMGNAYLSGDEQSLDKEIQKFYTGRNTERVRNHKTYMDEKRRREQEEQKRKSLIAQTEARRQSLNRWATTGRGSAVTEERCPPPRGMSCPSPRGRRT